MKKKSKKKTAKKLSAQIGPRAMLVQAGLIKPGERKPGIWPHMSKVEAAIRVARLEYLCAEVYQVVGILADMAGVFETSNEVSRALDYLNYAAGGRRIPKKSLLPFQPKPQQPIVDLRRMPLSDVKVGMRLRPTLAPNDDRLIATVTAVEFWGFVYKLDAPVSVHPRLGITWAADGHKAIAIDGYVYYAPVSKEVDRGPDRGKEIIE